jgi:hypothetical protein
MPEPPRYGNCIGFRIAKKVIETLIISMGPYVPPVGFSSTLLPGRSIAIIGLGYVGLPLAVEFGKCLPGGRLRHQAAAHR